MSSVSENKNRKTHFCVSEANHANAYASQEAWQNFCQQQKELELNPSPLALSKLKLQDWWKEPEITAKAA
jgi:hypothetical protein